MTSRFTLLFLILACFLGCAEDESPEARVDADVPEGVSGLQYVTVAGQDVAAAYDQIKATLTANDKISVVAEIDHAANAASTGETLRPTRVVLFGNPALGTPLMQINPQAGLDLPQKLLVYQAQDGQTIVAYNAVDYLASRHGVGAAETLPKIKEALAGLATSVGEGEVRNGNSREVGLDAGVISERGPGSVDSVYQRLKEAITGNPKLKLVAELDHQANAASVGMELPPIRLLIFGNPELGTPLLQDRQSIGIDLPQKMLVYQAEDGEVVVAYNDPAYLADRHGVNGESLGAIREALDGLARQSLGR